MCFTDRGRAQGLKAAFASSSPTPPPSCEPDLQTCGSEACVPVTALLAAAFGNTRKHSVLAVYVHVTSSSGLRVLQQGLCDPAVWIPQFLYEIGM